MTRAETMTRHYVAAIYFTDTGDSDQPSAEAQLTPLCRAQALIDCRNFLAALSGAYGELPINGLEDLDLEQLGHDLWLTRNGHGAGFWDRGLDVYTGTQSTQFCRLATAMGGRESDFETE